MKNLISTLIDVLATTLIFVHTAHSDGLHLRVSGKRNGDAILHRRGNIVGTSSLSNSGDVSYYANISLGGVQFSVLIDTGSSDLWVAGSVTNSKSTGKSASVMYAIGAVTGPVKTASLEFSGYQISDQAFIQVTSDSSHPEGVGLIGLGPNKGSNVLSAVGDSSGDAVLDRIFKQNTSTPNYLTVLMGRYDDPTDTFPGDLTVGTVLSGYEAVNDQPKLVVTEVSIYNSGDQHWQTLLDADGILGPDGQALSLATEVDATSNGKQLTVVFDTGFSLPQVPKYISDAIYGRIPGATYVNRSDVGPIWQVPCDKEINVTFIFQSNKFPIHPLDTNVDLNVTDSSGNRVCLGGFQPITTTTGGTYDAILGMAFLRNVYTLINYGDFVDGTSTTANPFIQLLATTNDTAEAHLDFVQVRMSGSDNTDWSLLPPSSSGSPPTTESNFVRRLKYYAPIIGGVAGAILLGVILWLMCRRRSRKRNTVMPSFMSSGRGHQYRPLQEPAPQGAVDLHLMNNGEQQQRRYPGPPPTYDEVPRESTDLTGRNPWDARY